MAQTPTPEPPPKETTLEPPPPSDEQQGGLQLDQPELGAPPAPSAAGGTGGTGSLVFGGTLDYRFLFPKEMPSGMYMIHVNELFFTTNIGDYISILAEQLLLTSDVGTVVGQDHGFVYATFSNLPWLADGMAFRIGRMRLRYGVDAKLDAPANPLRTTEYRTIGILSDRAIEVAGFLGPIELVGAVAMGPDFVLRDVVGLDGQIAATVKTPQDSSFHPFYVRLGTDFKGNLPNWGLSGFYGDAYPVLAADGFQAGDAMLFGGFYEQHRIIRKERVSLDGRWNYRKLKFSGEYTIGKDRDEGQTFVVQAWYFRTDWTIRPQKLTAQLQYDWFTDGRPDTPRIGAMGAAMTYNLTDESWLRVFFQGNQRLVVGEDVAWVAGSQILMAF
ncbi:MAG: hypothetical protein ACOZIN_19195 [Myxococcota bacterium]